MRPGMLALAALMAAVVAFACLLCGCASGEVEAVSFDLPISDKQAPEIAAYGIESEVG